MRRRTLKKTARRATLTDLRWSRGHPLGEAEADLTQTWRSTLRRKTLRRISGGGEEVGGGDKLCRVLVITSDLRWSNLSEMRRVKSFQLFFFTEISQSHGPDSSQ